MATETQWTRKVFSVWFLGICNPVVPLCLKRNVLPSSWSLCSKISTLGFPNPSSFLGRERSMLIPDNQRRCRCSLFSITSNLHMNWNIICCVSSRFLVKLRQGVHWVIHLQNYSQLLMFSVSSTLQITPPPRSPCMACTIAAQHR